ncbi:MAG: 3-oxoacyl-[acyl-carrier-protein] reductase [Calditrichia bacterium]
MKEFKEKVAVITGSSRGIGAEIAAEFARRGAAVVLSGRNPEKLQEMEETLSAESAEVISVAADVGKMEEAVHLMEQAIQKFGKVDILVNNAGITRDNLLMRMKEEEWDQVIQTNLKGTYNCIKAVTRPMMKQRDGRIINITSVVGQMGNAGQVNYAASKAGIIGLTKSVARELASRNITCNAVAPGFIETEMTGVLDDKIKENLQSQIPLGRLGSVRDVAAVVCFLAGQQASYITGQVLNVDGGMVMA